MYLVRSRHRAAARRSADRGVGGGGRVDVLRHTGLVPIGRAVAVGLRPIAVDDPLGATGTQSAGRRSDDRRCSVWRWRGLRRRGPTQQQKRHCGSDDKF
jgi:hypothetical protein